MSKLVLFLADGSTLDVVLARERITIGRRPDNDVCLPYPAVSGEHAAVVTILSDSFLEDLGSTNGTLVNGKPIAKHFLRDRDEIDIGRQKLVYLVDDAVQLAPSEKSLGRLQNRIFGERVQPAKSAAVQDEEDPVAPPDESPVQRKASRARSPAVEEEVDTGGALSDIDRFVAAEVGAGRAGDAVPSAAPAAAPDTPAEPVPCLRVLSGPNAGRQVALDRAETLVGRVGVQVAAVQRADGDFRLVLLEGDAPPRVNGEAIAPEGLTIKPGDTLEIAGVKLEIAGADATDGR